MTVYSAVKGLIVGGVIGATLGILFAPKSGKETRLHITTSTNDLLDKAKRQFEEASQKLEQLSDREKGLYGEKKNKLKRAVEAGVEAYKQEKADSSQASMPI